MTTKEASQLLAAFRAGRESRDAVLRAFQAAPLGDLGFAQVDTHRALRKGFPDVIYGAGKTPAQVVKIAAKIYQH
ncbi:MAG: 1-(5-phosphoribosyl)-5-amino-4-imidazole-carboxylate carboxylase, partial [Verrucomicrobia bacterium]|nr:1-(5-phosphoribosyl)-5-amino-4-imidazole-carboxylate carboxylase [Verrucomicrobiota bacterium]